MPYKVKPYDKDRFDVRSLVNFSQISTELFDSRTSISAARIPQDKKEALEIMFKTLEISFELVRHKCDEESLDKYKKNMLEYLFSI